MKMPQTTYDALGAALRRLDTEERRAAYRAGEFHNADRVADLDRRYRWDLFWLTGERPGAGMYVGDLADSHIETALRRLVPPLGDGRS